MNDDWVKFLLDLQKVDIELEKLADKIEKNPARKQLLNEQLVDVQKVFEEKTNAKREVENQIKDLQHQAQQKESIVLNLKTKMGSIKDNDTYTKILLEIEQTEKAISDLETEELELMEISDEKEKLVEEANSVLKNKKSLVDEQRTKLDKDLQDLKEQQANKKIEYKEYEALVDEDIYNKYKKIRNSRGGRKGAILVELSDDKCGGCFLKLIAQQLIDAKKRIPKTSCNNCGLLIYK